MNTSVTYQVDLTSASSNIILLAIINDWRV